MQDRNSNKLTLSSFKNYLLIDLETEDTEMKHELILTAYPDLLPFIFNGRLKLKLWTRYQHVICATCKSELSNQITYFVEGG
jgi:hypothetical protein